MFLTFADLLDNRFLLCIQSLRAELTSVLPVVSLKPQCVYLLTVRHWDSASSLAMAAPMVAGELQPKFFKEDIMLEVTPAATEQIAAYFSDKEVRPVRIFLNEGG